jgi:hypothetical protein
MAVAQSLTLTKYAPSVASNTSKVRILWQSTQAGESWNGYTKTCKYYVSINGGAETEYSVSYTLPKNATATIVDTTIIVTHKTDGSGSVKVRTWMDTGISAGVVTQEKTVDLDTIPRASTIDSLSCNTAYFTGALTYKFTPKSSSYYNILKITLNIDGKYTAVKSVTWGEQPASQQTADVRLTSNELSTIYNKLPKATKGKLRFTLYTYSDSSLMNQVGDAGYKEITLTIPNDTTTQPTMTMTLAPSSVAIPNYSGYVKGYSKVAASFSGEGKYGATISSYKLTVGGKDYGSPYTSDILSTAGSVSVKGTVTDSRGYSRSYSQTITVIDYAKPSIDSISCNTIYFDGTITLKYTPANSVFYSMSNVILDINGTWTTLRQIKFARDAVQHTHTITLSESELSQIYNKLPNGTSGVLYFDFQTFIDSGYVDRIGDTDGESISLNIPETEATKPTATFTISPESSLSSPFNSLYIKGKTKVKANLTSGAGKYGATIKSYSVSIGALKGTPPLTSEYITSLGDITVAGTVTDSRGFSRTYTKTVSVIDHSAPRLLPISGQSEVIAARCNSEGVLDDNGTYLKIAAKRAYSKVESAGVQNNYCKIQYRYRVEGGSYSSWTDILSRTATSDEVITGALLGGALSTASTYRVQIRAIDDLGEAVTTNIFISTEKVYMHEAASLNSLGIGKYAEEENVVDVAEDITAIFRGEVQFTSEAWIPRALGTNVVESAVNSGRWGGTGVFYRVCAGGKHIYVAFNVSFTTSSSTVRADSETIPSAYRPSYDVYALCPVGFSDNSRGIATVSISPSGRVNIYAVHKLPGATLSTGETVKWIDGYVDFWT